VLSALRERTDCLRTYGALVTDGYASHNTIRLDVDPGFPGPRLACGVSGGAIQPGMTAHDKSARCPIAGSNVVSELN
jgi:hypothetical protein